MGNLFINWEEREFLCASIIMAGLAANPSNDSLSRNTLASLASSSAESLVAIYRARQEA